MLDRATIDAAIKEAEGFIGQKRIWVRNYGLPDVVVQVAKCSVNMVFTLNLDEERIDVAEMIWCNYIDSMYKIDKVWFDKARFLMMPVVEVKNDDT